LEENLRRRGPSSYTPPSRLRQTHWVLETNLILYYPTSPTDPSHSAICRQPSRPGIHRKSGIRLERVLWRQWLHLASDIRVVPWCRPHPVLTRTSQKQRNDWPAEHNVPWTRAGPNSWRTYNSWEEEWWLGVFVELPLVIGLAAQTGKDLGRHGG
jgi:hypothetical protein